MFSCPTETFVFSVKLWEACCVSPYEEYNKALSQNELLPVLASGAKVTPFFKLGKQD